MSLEIFVIAGLMALAILFLMADVRPAVPQGRAA